MTNDIIQRALLKGMLIVDARYLYDTNLKVFISKLINSIKDTNIKLGLLIPNTHNENMYQNILINGIDVTKYFYVYLKTDFDKPNKENMKNMFFKKPYVLFLTQDQYIGFEIHNLTCDGLEINVARASKNGLLESFPMISGKWLDDRPLFSYIQGRSPRIDKISKECDIPGLNDTIFINKKPIVLTTIVGIGGEGKVYEISNEIVAKIYNRRRLTKTRAQKISLMASKRINDYSICWPIDEIRNKEGFIVGYTMKRCNGKPISTLYRGMNITKSLYPNYTYIDSIDISINILKKIQKLHYNNILLGDINDRNFVIDESMNVYFIDTDSYQLEDYSCDVGTIGYIAPELKEGILNTTLRSFEDECYAIAVLVFRTLMHGHLPFAQVGAEEDFVRLIKKQSFPYSLSNFSTKRKAPKSAFEYWNKLPKSMKEMFISTFSNKTNEIKRFSIDDWLVVLELFKNELINS